MFTWKNELESLNCCICWTVFVILIKRAGYVDWILICNLSKFGKYIGYNFRDINFFLGVTFFWRALYNVAWMCHIITRVFVGKKLYISLQYKAEDTSCTAIPADWDGPFLPAAGSQSLVPPRQLLLKDVMLEPWSTAAAHRPPSLHPAVEQRNCRPAVIWVSTVGIDWSIEQCLTSPPTQYKLSGRQFYRSKDPTNSIRVLKE